MARTYARRHNVWETAIWIQAANRRLVRRRDGHHAIVPAEAVSQDDIVLPNDLRPCTVHVPDDGFFSIALTEESTNLCLYDRGDPIENEKALQEALPALFCSFRP